MIKNRTSKSENRSEEITQNSVHMDKEMENRKKEYNIGEYLRDPGIRKQTLKETQATLTLKEKIDKLYYIKLGTSIYHKTLLRE